MATFDNVVRNTTNRANYKGYVGNPPTNEEEYNALDCWTDSAIAPTWGEVSVSMALEEVRVSRKAEYPPAEDYLDGIVKGDQAQVDKYIADCQAVKDKYPKE